MHTQRIAFGIAGIFVSLFLIFSGFTLSASTVRPISFAPVAHAGGGGGGSGGDGLLGILVSIVVVVVLWEIAPAIMEATSIAVPVPEGVAAAMEGSAAVGYTATDAAGAVMWSETGAVASEAAVSGVAAAGGNITYFVSVNPLAALAGSAVGAAVGGSLAGAAAADSPYLVPSTSTNTPGDICYSEKNACGSQYKGVLATDPKTGVIACKIGDSFATPTACFAQVAGAGPGETYTYDKAQGSPGDACYGPANTCGQRYQGVLDYIYPQYRYGGYDYNGGMGVNINLGDFTNIAHAEQDSTLDAVTDQTRSAPSPLYCFIPNEHVVGDSSQYNLYGAQSLVPSTPPPPTCVSSTATLTANPDTIDSGQSSTLVWSSKSATSCTGTGFSTGDAPANATGVSTGPLTTTSSYQLVCTGASGASAPAQATVTVLKPDISTFEAIPIRVKSNTVSKITWRAIDVSSCTLSDNAGNTLASSNADSKHVFSNESSPFSVTIKTQTVFTIVCQTLSKPITKTVLVNVVPSFGDF